MSQSSDQTAFWCTSSPLRGGEMGDLHYKSAADKFAGTSGKAQLIKGHFIVSILLL